MRELDMLPGDVLRITVAAAMLTPDQLAKAFSFNELRRIQADLRLPLSRTKSAAIKAIAGYFA